MRLYYKVMLFKHNQDIDTYTFSGWCIMHRLHISHHI